MGSIEHAIGGRTCVGSGHIGCALCAALVLLRRLDQMHVARVHACPRASRTPDPCFRGENSWGGHHRGCPGPWLLALS